MSDGEHGAFKWVGRAGALASISAATPMFASAAGVVLGVFGGAIAYLGEGQIQASMGFGSAFVGGMLVGSVSLAQLKRRTYRKAFSYVYERVEISCQFQPGSRVPIAWTQSRTIKALTDTVHSIEFPLSYGDRPGGRHIHSVRCPQGTVEELRDGDLATPLDPGQRFRLTFDDAVRPGQTRNFDLTIQLKKNLTRKAGSHFVYRVVSPTKRLQINAVFGEHDQVKGMRFACSASPKAFFWSEPVRRRALPVYEQGVSRCVPGRVYGFRWEWGGTE